MLNKLKSRWIVTAAVVVGLSTTACAQLSPASIVPRLTGTDTEALPADDVAASPTVTVRLDGGSAAAGGAAKALSPQNVAVQRGSIDDQLSQTGRVAGAAETDVAFPLGGKVEVLAVRPGDNITEGQLLLQTESQDIVKNLSQARARLETAALRLQQSQAQTAAQSAAQQRDNARRAADDAQRKQIAIADAETNLRKAQDNLDLVSAGPTSTDRRTAETAVAAAQAALNKTTADRDRLYAGANPDDVRLAERALASSQSDVDRAQAELDRLQRGPDPDQVRAAERDVERAQTAVKVAQVAKIDENNTKAAHDAQVANAQLSLQDAQDRLARIKQAADPRDVSIAQRNLQVAKATADADKQRLDTLRKGPSQAVLDTADQAVDNAQAVLDNANDRLNDINSHPTPAEMRDARDRVTQAQAALTRARNQPATAISTDDGANALDVTILEQAIAQEQAGVAALEKNLTDTKLLAPFAGTVTSVYVRPGDSVDPAHPALTLTKPGALGLRVDLTDQDAARLKVGQPARITMDGGDGAPYAGTVASVTANTSGLGRTAVIKVDWPKDVPTIGRTATVMITVVHKDDVLLVPRKAVHSAGQTRYVQYLNGSSRKVANIQIGITSGDLIEVVSGLTEGQIVVVAP